MEKKEKMLEEKAKESAILKKELDEVRLELKSHFDEVSFHLLNEFIYK